MNCTRCGGDDKWEPCSVTDSDGVTSVFVSHMWPVINPTPLYWRLVEALRGARSCIGHGSQYSNYQPAINTSVNGCSVIATCDACANEVIKALVIQYNSEICSAVIDVYTKALHLPVDGEE